MCSSSIERERIEKQLNKNFVGAEIQRYLEKKMQTDKNYVARKDTES